jgi:hypothetical protein
MRSDLSTRLLSLLAAIALSTSLVACGDDEEETTDSGSDAGADTDPGDGSSTPDTTDPTDGSTGTDTGGTEDTSAPAPTDCYDGGENGGQPLTVTQPTPPAGLTDACTNEADLAIIEGGTVDPTGVAGGCGLNNLGAGDARACALHCVEQGTELSLECSSCYAATVACAIINCVGQCAADPGSAECQACRDDSGCTAEFYACSGLPEPTEGSGTEG